MLYRYFRQLLFTLDAETAHQLTVNALRFVGGSGIKCMRQQTPPVPTLLAGLELPNPVGAAAGLDKNGECIDGLAAMGFGFIEVGTVTPRAQSGNDKPRIFRIPAHEAMINRLGFNNKGVDVLVDNVRQSRFWRLGGIVGINIGKNWDTGNENALADYAYCLTRALEVARYITVNISSPNTKNLRDLQNPETLKKLLSGLIIKRDQVIADTGRRVPLFVKIAPDLLPMEIAEIGRICLDTGIDGIVATNTSIQHDSIAGEPYSGEQGGLSGAPLRIAANATLKILIATVGDDIPVIGVGGITKGIHAREKFELGAAAVQLYTGLVYAGPKLVRNAITESIGRVKPRSRNNIRSDKDE